MPAAGRHAIVASLMRSTAVASEARGPSDSELLARFAANREEEAFAILVTRHGGMVLDVCRSVLGNEADAEDAFQAAFLVLARNARRVRKAGSVGAWLYGVASRTAQKARVQIARRRSKESGAPPPAPANPEDYSWRDVRRVVHESLATLAEGDRSALVLCYLQGLRQDDAAAALGVSRVALKKRLERGRERLRAELIRRGLGPTALLAALSVPTLLVAPALAATTVEHALLFAAGHSASIPVQVLKFTTGGQTMLSNKFVTALCLVPALMVAGVLAGTSGQQPTRAEESPPPPAAAPVQDDKARDLKDKKAAADPDLAKIDGEWKVKHIETSGKGLLNDEQLKASRMTFKDEKAEVKGFDVLGSSKFSFKLDSTKTPKEIDIKILEGPQKGEAFQGIYLVRKDEMRICLRLEGTEFGRPKGYVTNSGTTLYTFILERVGAKPAVPAIQPREAPPEKPEPAARPAGPGTRLNIGLTGSPDGGSITSDTKRGDGKDVPHGLQVRYGPEKKITEYSVYNMGALEQKVQFYPGGKDFRRVFREHNGDGSIEVLTPDDSGILVLHPVDPNGQEIRRPTQARICLCMMKADKPWEGSLLTWERIPNGYGFRLVMQEYRDGKKLTSTPFAIEKLGLPKGTEHWQWPWDRIDSAPWPWNSRSAPE